MSLEIPHAGEVLVEASDDLAADLALEELRLPSDGVEDAAAGIELGKRPEFIPSACKLGAAGTAS